MASYRRSPTIRFVRFTGAGDQVLPSDCGAVIGICIAVGTSAQLEWAGAADSPLAVVTAAVIQNFYFPTPMPVKSVEGGIQRTMKASAVGVSADYTIVYVPKRSSEY